MKIISLIFGFDKENRIRSFYEYVSVFLSLSGILKEYFLLGSGWKWKIGYFRFYFQRGLGLFNLFRYFFMIIGAGALAIILTNGMPNWGFSIYFLLGLSTIWLFYTTGFLEYKLKLIDIETEIGSSVVSPPMRRIEEKAESSLRIAKETQEEIKKILKKVEENKNNPFI